MLPDTAPGSPLALPAAALYRTGAIIRHNTILFLREPAPLVGRIVLPLVFLALLHPLYQAAQGPAAGTAQAVIATLVTFSLLALSIAGSSILTERIWHTWERVRATAARPAELLAGKAVPVMAALLVQQAIIVGFGVAVLGLTVASPPLLVLALLAWTVALLGMGSALGVVARSPSEMSLGYDIGGMILSAAWAGRWCRCPRCRTGCGTSRPPRPGTGRCPRCARPCTVTARARSGPAPC